MTPVEVSLCGQAYTSMPAAGSISLREPTGASITCGVIQERRRGGLWRTCAPNSPKVRCWLRFSISEKAAASQNAVDPPLPSTTS